MNREIREKHFNRKNKPFYGLIGKKVRFYETLTEDMLDSSGVEKNEPRYAMIIGLEDEDNGTADLYLLKDVEHQMATSVAYTLDGDTYHRLEIENLDESRLMTNINYIDNIEDSTQAHWELAK
jgi:hypothetical protein